MHIDRAREATGITRRSLVRTLGGAAAVACLSGRSDAAEPLTTPSSQVAEARVEALVEAALSATPASLTAEQRLDVRRGVRDLQKTLADARRVPLGYDADPATIFLPEGRR